MSCHASQSISALKTMALSSMQNMSEHRLQTMEFLSNQTHHKGNEGRCQSYSMMGRRRGKRHRPL